MERLKTIFVGAVDFLDPGRRSFLFFKYKTSHVIILAALVLFVYAFHVTRVVYLGDTSKGFVHALLDNPVVYLPNYLTHEFGHRLTGGVVHLVLPWPESCSADDGMCLARWLETLAGNGVETFVPLVLLLLALRIKGGDLLAPPLMYWLSTTIYSAAIYVSDARAKFMALTSSDFLTNYKPGETNGDWYFILKPLGLLNYDILIGQILFLLAAFVFVMAIYSAYYYFANMEEISKRELGGANWNKKEAVDTTVYDNVYQGPPPDETPDDKNTLQK